MLAVFLSSEVFVDGSHSCRVGVRKGFLHRAPIQVKHQHRGEVGHLAWQANHVGVLEVEFFELVAFADLNGDLAQGVIIEPENAEVC